MDAYLVIDMSNDFVDDKGSLSAGRPAQNIVKPLIDTISRFYENGDLVVFCMDAHAENDPHFELWPPHNIKGTWGSELYGELNEWYISRKDSENVYFLEKSEYDAFHRTDLEDILKSRGTGRVYAGGVCTDICVFNTVYGAYKAGFRTVVSAGECATFTGNHQIFLDQMNAVYKTEIIE